MRKKKEDGLMRRLIVEMALLSMKRSDKNEY